jgi:excinuclease ABC subunit B
VQKAITDLLESIHERDYVTVPKAAEEEAPYEAAIDINRSIRELKRLMKDAASKMEFEQAAQYRDRLLALERRQIEEGL